MTSQLVQAYVDKENTTSVTSLPSKGRLGSQSQAGRKGANLFPSASPRRALGNLSNNATRLTGSLGNSQKKPLNLLGNGLKTKTPLGSQSRTPGLSLRNPNVATPFSQTSAPKAKSKPQLLTASSNLIKPAETYPDIETMHIFQDKESDNETLPPEDCLSSCLDRLSSLRVPPMPHPQIGRWKDVPTDFSHLQLELNDRLSESHTTAASLDSMDVDSPSSLDMCLGLLPLQSTDFMDINSFKLWDV